MITRHVMAVIALVACTSCLPQAEQSRVSSRVGRAIPPPASDRQLLHMLALKDPLGQPAPPVATEAASRLSAPPFEMLNASVEDTQRATDCLTAAVYYEARSEPLDGQRAVAQVVLNRVRDRAFPNSVCKVVYQRPPRGSGCQFSFACDGSTDRPLDGRAWAIARGVALAALNGSVFAPVGSATYYHTTAVLPWWAASLSRIGLVGSHIFYRWREGLGRALSFRQAYSGVEAAPGSLLADRLPAGPAAEPAVLTSDDTGTDMQNGVIIHRSAVPRPAGSALVTVSFGVRVHRGTHPEAADTSASLSSADSGDAAALAS